MFSLLAEIIAASDLQNCKAEERRRASQIFPGCRGGAALTEESVAEQSAPLSLDEISKYSDWCILPMLALRSLP